MQTSKLTKFFFRCLLNLQEIPWSLSRQLSNSWKLKVDLVETFSNKCLLKKIQCKTSENVNIINYTGADREVLLNCSAHLSASTGLFLIAIYDDCEQSRTWKLCFLSFPMCVYSTATFWDVSKYSLYSFLYWFHHLPIYTPLLHHTTLSVLLQHLHSTSNFTISIV